MLNYVWLALILLAVLIGGFTGHIREMVEGGFDSAEKAVKLALGLIGVMTLWLGVMRLAEKAGVVQTLARVLRPALRWLFPEVPVEHPAMGAMVMNIAANILGLSNAATPLGLRAMRDLESLNPHPGTATNAMCTFLAINTGSLQLVPASAIAVMVASGSKNPSAIIGTAFLASLCTTATGITAVKVLEKLRVFRVARSLTGPAVTDPVPAEAQAPLPAATPVAPMPWWGWLVLLGFVGCFGWFLLALIFPEWAGRTPALDVASQGLLVRAVGAASLLAIPFLLAFFPLYAALRRIAVYEEFVEGAKEGFHVAVRIIAFLVTMMVAIGMFRSAGGVKMLTDALQPGLDLIHFPAELLPMALMRPLSGSGSFAIFSDLVKQYGPDHILSRMAGTLYGSTETTFYVIAVYFGSVGVKRTRHAVPAGLMADAAGIAASVIVCRLVFG